MLFVIALYTQVANLRTHFDKLSYGMFIQSPIGYGLVMLYFFSTRFYELKYFHQQVADKIIGVLLILLGVGLLFILVK